MVLPTPRPRSGRRPASPAAPARPDRVGPVAASLLATDWYSRRGGGLLRLRRLTRRGRA